MAFVAAFIAILIAASISSAQCQYEVTAVIETPPCPPPFNPGPLTATAMNNHGHVVGYYRNCVTLRDEGFIWKPETGVVTMTRPPGVAEMRAEDINDHGVIVGHWVNKTVPGGTRGFVYWPDTNSYTELDTLSGAGWGMAHAINNNNVVVGERATENKAAPRIGFVWTQSGGFIDIHPMVSGGNLWPRDIDDLGTVTGTDYSVPSGEQGFRWFNGKKQLLGIIPGGTTSNALANAADRRVVGSGRIPGPGLGYSRGFVWDNGVFVIVQPLANYEFSSLSAINSAAVAIGQSVDSDTSDFRAILWQCGTRIDLNTLIVSDGQEILLTRGIDINENGLILAHDLVNVGVVLRPIDSSPSDLNTDCRVDVCDLMQLLHVWNTSYTSGDLDDSGRVDVFDLFILLSDWTG